MTISSTSPTSTTIFRVWVFRKHVARHEVTEQVPASQLKCSAVDLQRILVNGVRVGGRSQADPGAATGTAVEQILGPMAEATDRHCITFGQTTADTEWADGSLAECGRLPGSDGRASPRHDFAPYLRILHLPGLTTTMTYCVGLSLEDGLVFASDSPPMRAWITVTTYSKMHVFTPAPDLFVLLSAGNLATTVVNHIQRDLDYRPAGQTWPTYATCSRPPPSASVP